MSLDISPETEARLAAKAKEQGLSIDAYLQRLMEPLPGVRGIDLLKEGWHSAGWHRQRRRSATACLESRRTWYPSESRNLRR